MIRFYNILVHTALIVFLPVLAVMVLFSAKRRQTLFLRLGTAGRFPRKKQGETRIWVHALSVGEVRSALPVVRALKAARPGISLIFTASTKTGYDTACQQFADLPLLVDHTGYFPFDLPFCIHKRIRQIDPNRVCLVETDLWPNFLHILKEKNIPALLLNARLSTRSFKGYHRFKSFFAMTFSTLAMIFVQTREDKERFEALGIPPEKIKITGNIKFDQPVPVLAPHEAEALSIRMGLKPEAPVIIAGSTHSGEEEILASVFRHLKASYPALKMIVAPRDPKRAEHLIPLFTHKHRAPVLFSRMGPEKTEPDVILIDVMGILARLYFFADLVFIGGSLVPRGGHNPLEAAALSKPVLFGPHMTDFAMIAEKLVQCGAATMVMSEKELLSRLQALLEDTRRQQAMGQKARSFYLENRGAVNRCLEQMEAAHFI